MNKYIYKVTFGFVMLCNNFCCFVVLFMQCTVICIYDSRVKLNGENMHICVAMFMKSWTPCRCLHFFLW